MKASVLIFYTCPYVSLVNVLQSCKINQYVTTDPVAASVCICVCCVCVCVCVCVFETETHREADSREERIEFFTRPSIQNIDVSLIYLF